MTRRWDVQVGIFRDNQDMRDNRPLKVMSVTVENDERHDAMALAELETKELLTDQEGLAVWALEAKESYFDGLGQPNEDTGHDRG